MGLEATITIDDLGLKRTVSGTALEPVDSDGNGVNNYLANDNPVTVTVDVDYSQAFADFANTFYDIATEIVPVRTGFLQSTIWRESDDSSITAGVDADYAQYVEYGTYKMEAQPYFRPALEQAWASTQAEFEEAVDEAQQELAGQIGSIQGEGAMDGGGGGGVWTGELFSSLLASALVGIIQGFFKALNEIGDLGNQSNDNMGSMGFDEYIQIT